MRLTEEPGTHHPVPPDQATAAEVEACLHLAVEALDLSAPPTRTILSLQPQGSGCRVSVHGPDGGLPAVLAWLEDHAPLEHEDRQRLDGNTAGCVCPQPPGAWRRLLASFRVPRIELSPDGRARLTLIGRRPAIQTFVAEHRRQAPEGSAGEIVVERVSPQTSPGPKDDLLTARQLEALEIAVEHGYYGVPRQTSLRDLASQMQMSAGALSELLRRAEARLIKAYVTTHQTQGQADPAPAEATGEAADASLGQGPGEAQA